MAHYITYYIENGILPGESEDPKDSEPLNILFLGNSFTNQGSIPDVVEAVASSVGWASPNVINGAVNGQSLSYHRSSSSSLGLVDQGNWDYVVLQEYSTGPTDSAGNPQGFKEDVAWFYDRIKQSSPDATIVLYETWARHPDHSIYPDTFDDFSDMQSQLRFHYNDAADNYVPSNSDIVVARAGDAWEQHLNEDNPLRLHASDDYHANTFGQYLSGLMIYSSIYGCDLEGVSQWNVQNSGDAERLQSVVGFICESLS
jgi:hypothetical protein